MFRTIRSFVASLRASASVGRASSLARQGRDAEAIQVARIGLSKLRMSFVNRCSPPEGAALASLTTILESLAYKTNVEGAEVADLQDSLAFLKALGPVESPPEGDLRSWIPYLEAKLSQTPCES
jgi:hypothetical protein